MITFTVLTIVIEHFLPISKRHLPRSAPCIAFGIVSAFPLAAPIYVSFTGEARLSIESPLCRLEMRVAHSMYMLRHTLYMHDPSHSMSARSVVMLPLALVT